MLCSLCVWSCGRPDPSLPCAQMTLLMREALTVGKVAFHPQFFSVEMMPDEAKRRLKDEIANFCVVVEPPKTTFGKARNSAAFPSLHTVQCLSSCIRCAKPTRASCTASKTTW